MSLISHSIRFSIFCAIALSVSACATSPTVISNADTSVNFSGDKSYGIFETLATDKAN